MRLTSRYMSLLALIILTATIRLALPYHDIRPVYRRHRLLARSQNPRVSIAAQRNHRGFFGWFPVVSDSAMDSQDTMATFSPIEPWDKEGKPISPAPSYEELSWSEPSDKATSPANTETPANTKTPANSETPLHNSSPNATRTATLFPFGRSRGTKLPAPSRKLSSASSNGISSRRGRTSRHVALNRDDTSLHDRSQSWPAASSRLQRQTSKVQHSSGVESRLNKSMEDSNYGEEDPALGPSANHPTTPPSGFPAFPPPTTSALLTPSTPTVKRPRATSNDLGDTPPAKRRAKEDEYSQYSINDEWKRFRENLVKEKDIQEEKEELQKEKEKLRRLMEDIRKREKDLKERERQIKIEMDEIHAKMQGKIHIN